MSALRTFLADGLREVTQGSVAYHLWMALLTLVMLCGAYAYSVQLREGLVVTGMHDHMSWGLYISSFTFLVGVAAAAVILVMPTYVLARPRLQERGTLRRGDRGGRAGDGHRLRDGGRGRAGPPVAPRARASAS